MVKFTGRQWITLGVYSFTNLCGALCASIQAPFFPAESEKKGLTPSQYGFIFGIYELVIFIASPVLGQYLNTLGIKFLTTAGCFTLSVTCTLFGFLDDVQDTTTFLVLAYTIRITEALGASACVIATFSVIAREFSSDLGTIFAVLESCFGLGLILGPTVGGILFEVGGFKLPFVVVSGFLILTTFVTLWLPPVKEENQVTPVQSEGIISLVLHRSIIFFIVTEFCSSFSIGFIVATLEPHLRSLNLTPARIGTVFMLNGIAYAVSSPFFGRLCDHHMSPLTVCSVGAALNAAAFLLIGPVPFLHLHKSLLLIIVGVLLNGLATASQLVATFSGFHKDSIDQGFPDDINTYGLVAGLFTSVFSLGSFVGPSVSGILYDNIGFPWASQTVVGLHAFLLLATLIYICMQKKRLRNLPESIMRTSEAEPLLSKERPRSRSNGSIN